MKAQIWSKRGWVKETDSRTLKMFYGGLLRESGFVILNSQEHYFTPQGFTILWLLGESHLAIHTFPEEGKTYVELSSCNKVYFEYFIKNCGF